MPIPNFEANSFQMKSEHFLYLVNYLNALQEEMKEIKDEMINLHYPSPFFTKSEAMDYLRISRKKFWEYERDGLINAYSPVGDPSPKMKRYKREELEKLMQREPTFIMNLD